MIEEVEGEKHLIRLALPDEEKEPKMLITWQYIWDENICALFSAVLPDGRLSPRRFLLLGDCAKGTAKECLLEMVAEMEKELKEICKEEQAAVAIVDRNPKRGIGFLKELERR